MKNNREELNPPPKKIVFRGELISLIIRPLDGGDAECICKAVKKSEEILKPFLDWPHQDWTLERQAARLRKARINYDIGNEYELGVFCPTKGEFLMAASWSPAKTQNKKSLEIGYWTHIDHCRKGLATLVSQILVIIAFDFMGCDRIEVRCKKGNIASQRVVEKCGFRFEGEARNYFALPTETMLTNGYSPERASLQYALIPEDKEYLTWYQPILEKLGVIFE